MLDLALFGHVLGATLLISAVVITVSGLLRAHRATTSEQIRAAMSGVPVADHLMPPAMILVLGFGLYLVAARDHHRSGTVHWDSGWVIVSLALFAVMSILGPAIEARRAARLHRAACAAPDGPIDADLDRLRRDPLHTHITLFGASQLLTLLYLMTNRPDFTATLVATATATLVSVVTTRLTLSTIPSIPTETPNQPTSTPAAVEGTVPDLTATST